MIGLSLEIACGLLIFPVLQAIAVCSFLALALWHDRRPGIRREQARGGPA